ncbi:hypothetical protein DQ04_24421000 [Trypanosoma grayi]|uniref:hypothetical protein n=1 Tax=Trypanosoma grayi TaxID=71804 RepID=UPI0004F429CB|nr:hypothetical protein DQ04_24421000 [Trypanosoma grayi]KEG05264.1 hypothetical protein DQ04_24421000 [Trypanosoma grayi]
MKAAEETEKMLKKALEEAPTVITRATAAYDGAENASKSAVLVMQLLEKALTQGKKGVKEAPAASQDRSPARTFTGQTHGDSHNIGHRQGQPSSPSTPRQHSAQQQAPNPTEGAGSPSDTSKKKSDEISSTRVRGNTGGDTDKASTSTVSTQAHSATQSREEKDDAGAPLTGPNSNADTTLRDVWSADSSVSPSWVRTPLLLVVGVLGLLAVC